MPKLERETCGTQHIRVGDRNLRYSRDAEAGTALSFPPHPPLLVAGGPGCSRSGISSNTIGALAAKAAAPLLHGICAPRAHPLLRHLHLGDPTHVLHILASPAEDAVVRLVCGTLLHRLGDERVLQQRVELPPRRWRASPPPSSC
jgi:hypothetical protein